MKYAHESLRQLRKENRELQVELQAARDKLSAAMSQAEMCRKAARDAWQFARVALRTGRNVAHE